MDNKTNLASFDEERRRRMAVERDLNLRLRQQEAIAALGEYALRCRDLDALFAEAVRLVTLTLDMELCKILQLLPNGKELLLRAGTGWTDGLVGSITVGAELNSQAGFTLLSDQPVIVSDTSAETRFAESKLLQDHQVMSGMSVVIPGRSRPFGVLGVHSRHKRDFVQHDTRFIKAIASILASSVERFHTEEELRRSRDEMAIILQGITEGVTVQDTTGKIIFANQSAAHWIGFDSVEALLTARPTEILARFILYDENGDPFPVEKLPGRLSVQNARQETARVRFRVKETGEERWSIVDAAPIFDDSGRVMQTVNIFRDITDMALSEQYQKLLAEASEQLSTSLGYREILARIAQLSVPNLADWCIVDLLADSQELQRIAVVHKDPARLQLAAEYQALYPASLESDNGVSRVLRTGQPEYYPKITDEMLSSMAHDETHLAMLRALGIVSAIVVPLSVRGKTFGAITFIWAESGRRFRQRDIELTAELARRAAIVVENARLYQEAQELNAELEQRVENRTRQLEQSYQRVAQEVEERRRAEQALQKSETLLNSLFESAPDAAILVDSTSQIVRVNQQAEQLFGYRREELFGRPIDLLIPARLRGYHARQRAHYFEDMVTRSMGAGLELSALRKDGQELPVDIMLSPVHTEQGELVICSVRNITEQKRLHAELAETHQRLFESIEAERLSLSQELHDGPIQDLYGIGLNLEALRADLPPGEALDTLMAAKDNLQMVIQGLRTICGELRPPTLAQFGLEKAIRSHLAKLRETHPGISFKAELMNDGALLSERARLALYRVYQNAVSNTLRHAGAKNILIDFRIEADEIHFVIQDDGKGFSIPRRWVDLAREGHFGLVGMIERVEAIGGRLEVESEIGRGTTVRVSVPRESAAMPAVPAVN